MRVTLRFLRLSMALLLTAVVLPFLHAYLFYVILYVGVSPVFLVMNLLGLVAIAWLVRGLGSFAPLDRWHRPLGVVVLLLWIGGTALTKGPLLELRVPPWQHLLIASVASLWEPAFAWSTFRPMTWRRRLSIILPLLLLQGLYPLFFRIDGVTGYDYFIVSSRFAPIAPPVAVQLGEETTNIIGGNFPQYLGPDRNATVAPLALEPDWTIHPPTLVWQRPVGAGWGAFAVQDGLAVTAEQRADNECVVAYDLLTGKEKWVHQSRIAFTQSMGGPGPRATPTIAGGSVFALGATGQLSSLALQSGSQQWERNILEDVGASNDDNGVTSSPLVIDGLVIVGPTGSSSSSLLAYKADDGALVWQASGAPASYSSPNVTHLGGETQIVHLDGDGLAGHALKTGATLWRFPFNADGNSCPQPILRPGDRDTIFLSTDRNGAALVEILHNEAGWKAAQRWKSQFMRTKFSNPVYLDGHVYGLDAGILACLRISDGKLLWKNGRYKHGQMLLVGTWLLVLSEEGELLLIEPSPQGLKEISKFQALHGKTWNNLALAGDLLLLRNAEQAACYRLAVQGPPPSDEAAARKNEEP